MFVLLATKVNYSKKIKKRYLTPSDNGVVLVDLFCDLVTLAVYNTRDECNNKTCEKRGAPSSHHCFHCLVGFVYKIAKKYTIKSPHSSIRNSNPREKKMREKTLYAGVFAWTILGFVMMVLPDMYKFPIAMCKQNYA